MGRGGQPNQDLLFILAARALDSVDGLATFYALERRHPDGRRWVTLARFATGEDADEAMKAVVEGGHVVVDDLRVQRVTHPVH
jgi:hypothetical protein